MALWHGLGLDAEVQLFHLGYPSRRQCISMKWRTGWRARCSTPPSCSTSAKTVQARLCRGPWLRRLPAARTAQSPRLSRQLAVFLGASYFRALGRNQRYGISSRGVAIDTGLPKQEEFPAFRRFWLERPAPGADGRDARSAGRAEPERSLQLNAAGRCHGHGRRGDAVPAPGDRAARHCAAHQHVFVRLERPAGRRRLRPQVHDSEGLQIWSGSGEWFWRPLVNPSSSGCRCSATRTQGLWPDAAHARSRNTRISASPACARAFGSSPWKDGARATCA